jgi:hypothetical protein
VANVYERFADAYWELNRLGPYIGAEKAAIETRHRIHKLLPTSEAATHNLMVAEKRLGDRYRDYLWQTNVEGARPKPTQQNAVARRCSAWIEAGEHYRIALEAAGRHERSELIKDERERVLHAVRKLVEFHLSGMDRYNGIAAAKWSQLLGEYGLTDEWRYQAAKGYIQSAKLMHPDSSRIENFERKSLNFLTSINVLILTEKKYLQDPCWDAVRDWPQFQEIEQQLIASSSPPSP